MPDITNEMMAEAIGWIRYDIPEVNDEVWYAYIDGGYDLLFHPPDYTHDLNLVHDLEGMLTTFSEWADYRNNLSEICCGNIYYTGEVEFSQMLLTATAQQKCNALFPIFEARKGRK